MARSTTAFDVRHLTQARPQPAQARDVADARGLRHRLSETQQELCGEAYTLKRDSRPILSAGVRELTPGCYAAWAQIGDAADRYDMLYAVREIRSFLKRVDVSARFRRIEALVDNDFTAGHRLARMLGFQREGVMRKRGLRGQDVALYART